MNGGKKRVDRTPSLLSSWPCPFGPPAKGRFLKSLEAVGLPLTPVSAEGPGGKFLFLSFPGLKRFQQSPDFSCKHLFCMLI